MKHSVHERTCDVNMGFQATPMDVTVQVLARVVLSDILYNSSLSFQFHGQSQDTTHDFWLVPSFSPLQDDYCVTILGFES
jgi:hypothetical protein